MTKLSMQMIPLPLGKTSAQVTSTTLHWHHIIPKHAGGTDDPENLIQLTVEQHIQAHLELYAKYGKYQDYCAAKMLQGALDPKNQMKAIDFARLAQALKVKKLGLPSSWYLKSPETRAKVLEKFLASGAKGRAISGEKNRVSGHMSRVSKALTPEQRKEYASMGGKATLLSGKGAFANPVERLKVAAKGGKVQGKVNAESGHLQRISEDRWRRVANGELPRREYKWYTNGVTSIAVSKGENVPEGFYPGRTLKSKLDN